jgi:hypothetical protein
MMMEVVVRWPIVNINKTKSKWWQLEMRSTPQQFPNLAKSNLWLAQDPRVRNRMNLSLEICLI